MRQWCQREFDRIADTLHTGRSQWAYLDVLGHTPDKPRTGMIAVFKPGVAGPMEGAYEYREGYGWTKL